MMDTLLAIDSLRVVRRFSDRPVDDDGVRAIVDAGRRAGSSKNLQRWDFVMVRDRARLAELALVGPYAGHLAGATVAIALVTPDPRADGAPLSVAFDLGRAAENMVLAAWALGIGSCPATVYEQEVARRLLGYPQTHHCEYVFSFGHPADTADLARPNRAGGRKAIDDVLHREAW
jgi:nitroreductase